MDQLNSSSKEGRWQPEDKFGSQRLQHTFEKNQYYTGTIEDLSSELHGSRYFNLMDAKSDYCMV